MFIFTEVNYRLSRSPGRSVILVLAAIMLVTSIGAYLGNLQASQAALNNLAESIPVTARVANRAGTQTSQLSIETAHYDALTSLEVHGVLCTAGAAGALQESAHNQEPFAGGDTAITGANCFAALPAVQEEDTAFLVGYSGSFLTGNEAVCAVSDAYAQQMGLALGDEITLPVYAATCSPYGVRYAPIGRHSLLVAAVYPYTERNGQRSPNMAVPVAWLRNATETAGEAFYYTSLSVVLDQPLYLTRFKESLMPLGFTQVSRDEKLSGACDAISMEDELFIKTAEELRGNLQTYRSFQLPFFGLVTVMVMLAVFLVLRGSRRDMAIASSLGEPRRRISLVHFSAAVLTQLLGGCIAMIPLVLRMGITLGDSLWIIMMYLLCACAGTMLALAQLLRFDTLTLLTKND